MKTIKFQIFLLLILSVSFFGYSQNDDCIIDSGVEMIPGPSPDPNFTGAATYASETTVQMCYTVDEYNTPGTQNWMHGIVPLFGPGWDLSTLQPIGQPETQFWAGGEWIWLGDVVAGITGELISSPGWWFDADSGGGNLDGDPADNWGDGNSGPWEFCWEITTQSCPPAFNEANLIVEILNFADSETGSWDNASALTQCIDDPSYYIQGLQLNCPTCDESELTVINPTCANVDETGGVVVITPQGIGPWNYIWFNLETGDIIEENSNVTLPVTVSGLTPAEYLIQVEDLGFPGGCASPVYFEILPPEQINVEINTIDATCLDSNDGELVISSIINSNCVNEELIAEDSNLDGVIDNDDFSCPSTSEPVCGCDFITYFNACQSENWYGISAYELGECPEENPDYVISWNSGNSLIGTGNSINNLIIGEYQLVVECVDNTSPVFGCTFETDLIIDSPPEFTYEFSVSDVSCFIDDNSDGINDITDGSVLINLSGGTEDYITTLGLQAGGLIDSQSGSSIIFSNLAAGDYYFTPTDFFGCLVFEQEVFFTISEPESLIIDNYVISDYNGFSVTCNNSADAFVNLNISGGTEPYSFNWSDGSEFQNLNNVSAGTYSVIVSDQNDCQVELNNLVLTEPSVVDIVTTSIQPVSCSGASDGSISVEFSGGAAPYSFSWLGPINLPDQLTISNLPTGSYTIFVVDNNGCQYEETFNIDTPNPILLTSFIDSGISCFGANDATLGVNAIGGDGLYTYEWFLNSIVISTDQFVSNLSPGVYEVVVTDSESCWESSIIEVVEPELLTATFATLDVDCYGDNTGSVITSISGGTLPYNQTWSSGANPNSLSAGTYELTITDDNGCVFNITDINITQPDSPLTLTADVTDVYPCNGDVTGIITPIANGGTPPYEYSILGGGNFNALSSGVYTVLVEDANSCITQNNFFIDQPSEVTANLTTTDVSCFGLTDGQATAIASGGTPPYSLNWTNMLTGAVVDNNNLSAGTYMLTIQDALLCSYNEPFVVSEPSSSDMEIVLDTNPSCLDPFDITVLGPSGVSGVWSGNGPGLISFSNPLSNTTQVTVTEYGTYELNFTDGCGEQIFWTVQMNSLSPQAYALPSVVYCEFETFLQASSSSDEGFWTLLDAPDNTNVTFVNGVNSFNTQIVATSAGGVQECCYGDYMFSFNSCGDEEYVSLSFEKEAPEFGVSTHQDCALDAQIFIYNPISFTDALIDPGQWQAVGNNAQDVTINYETPHEVGFSVDDYGFYEFRYFICDTFYQHFVGFSCPLDIPNVFTPNGDDNNDLFLAQDLIPSVHTQINFVVYNRFGQIVHAQSNYDYQNTLWDGTTNTAEDKELNDGVYYYTLELFNAASQRKESYNGYVHLFRGTN